MEQMTQAQIKQILLSMEPNKVILFPKNVYDYKKFKSCERDLYCKGYDFFIQSRAKSDCFSVKRIK